MFPRLFSICHSVFMPETDSLKHPAGILLKSLPWRKLSTLAERYPVTGLPVTPHIFCFHNQIPQFFQRYLLLPLPPLFPSVLPAFFGRYALNLRDRTWLHACDCRGNEAPRIVSLAHALAMTIPGKARTAGTALILREPSLHLR